MESPGRQEYAQPLETAGNILSKRPRYKRTIGESTELEEFFVDFFLLTTKEPSRLLILDFDATADPLHCKQEGRFLYGNCDCYCYLPLYVFCGDWLLWWQLRKADIDANKGARGRGHRSKASLRNGQTRRLLNLICHTIKKARRD